MQRTIEPLDFTHGCGILWVSLLSGRGGDILSRVGRPPDRKNYPTNAHNSQSVAPIAGENLASPVASRHCVNAGAKLTGRCCDGQGCLNPGNGLVVDPVNSAYVPVLENTAYLAISFTEAERPEPL